MANIECKGKINTKSLVVNEEGIKFINKQNESDVLSQIKIQNNKLIVTSKEGMEIDGIFLAETNRKLKCLQNLYASNFNSIDEMLANTNFSRVVWLFNGSVGSGNITLTASLENLDALIILGCNDSAVYYSIAIKPIYCLRAPGAYHNNPNTSVNLWDNVGAYWHIKNVSNSSKTLTLATENSVIKQIIGVKL